MTDFVDIVASAARLRHPMGFTDYSAALRAVGSIAKACDENGDLVFPDMMVREIKQAAIRLMN